MIFRPVVHPVLLFLIVLVAAAFVFLSAKRAARKRVMDIIRRSFIVVTVIIMGAGPSIPGQPSKSRRPSRSTSSSTARGPWPQKTGMVPSLALTACATTSRSS